MFNYELIVYNKDRLNAWVYKNPLISSFIFTSIVFISLLYLFKVTYLNNDDSGMMLWIRGIGIGKPSVRILFVNILYARFIRLLYDWINAIDWYPLIFLVILFISYLYISYLTFKYTLSVYMKILYVTVFLSTFLFPIVSLQFTIISGIAGIAGVYGLITSNNKKEKVVAFLLLIVSSLIRMDSFRLAIVVFIPAYIYKLYFYYFYKNHALFSLSHLKHNLWVLYLAISIAAAEILHHYSANAYGYYYQFNITRVEILDKEGLEKISHDDKTGILQNVGWSLNDYDMLMNWFFLDSTIYNKSNFLKIINLIPKKKINSLFNFIASNYKHLISEILSLPVMWALLLIYLSVILYEASYIKFFFLVITLLYFFLLYLLISFFYRVPPERVFIVMDAATAIIPFAINIIHSANSLFERVNNFYIRVLLVVISFYPVQKILRDTRYTIVYTWENFKKSDKQPLKEIVEELAAQYPNMKLLVSWAAAFPYEMIEPFKDTSYLNTIKIFSLGTYQQLPENQELLSKLNITDLYLAICEQPDIYVLILKRFADKYPILYQTYMKEHYKKNIIYQFLPDPFPNAVLVKFSIAEEK